MAVSRKKQKMETEEKKTISKSKKEIPAKKVPSIEDVKHTEASTKKTSTKKTPAKAPAKEKPEDFIFYKSDRVLAYDCSRKKFPEGCPMWVVTAIANRIIEHGIPEGMEEEHWYMHAGEDNHITLLDTGRMYLTLYHKKYEPIPKVVLESIMVTTREKATRKKSDE